MAAGHLALPGLPRVLWGRRVPALVSGSHLLWAPPTRIPLTCPFTPHPSANLSALTASDSPPVLRRLGLAVLRHRLEGFARNSTVGSFFLPGRCCSDLLSSYQQSPLLPRLFQTVSSSHNTPMPFGSQTFPLPSPLNSALSSPAALAITMMPCACYVDGLPLAFPVRSALIRAEICVCFLTAVSQASRAVPGMQGALNICE